MNRNSIAFTALCKEYCTLLGNPLEMDATTFANRILYLLPRIYICASDLSTDSLDDENDQWIEAAMTEDEYDLARRCVSELMGENDVYLEVFEEDMKYSDTPVSASISENLADIYQVLYDFLNTVRLGTDEVVDEAIRAVKASFREYWSATLCNVLRAVNHLWSKGLLTDAD